MKKIVLLAALSVAFTQANAQETKIQKETTSTDFNKWSIDVNAGLSKPTAPFSTNYYSSNSNFIHGDLGVRYMMNNKFGLKLDFGLDSF